MQSVTETTREKIEKLAQCFYTGAGITPQIERQLSKLDALLRKDYSAQWSTPDFPCAFEVAQIKTQLLGVQMAVARSLEKFSEGVNPESILEDCQGLVTAAGRVLASFDDLQELSDTLQDKITRSVTMRKAVYLLNEEEHNLYLKAAKIVNELESCCFRVYEGDVVRVHFADKPPVILKVSAASDNYIQGFEKLVKGFSTKHLIFAAPSYERFNIEKFASIETLESNNEIHVYRGILNL